LKGTVQTEAQRNEIWNAIKTIPTWQKDIVADVQVTGPPPGRTYTVKAEDTLSAIAKEQLGSAGD
jgi:LysM repeat protein